MPDSEAAVQHADRQIWRVLSQSGVLVRHHFLTGNHDR